MAGTWKSLITATCSLFGQVRCLGPMLLKKARREGGKRTVPTEFKIIYHYTSVGSILAIACAGIFPGVGSGKGHCYATRYSPWEVDASDPGARANRPICFAIDVEQLTHYGARVLVSDSGALLIPDWVPNHCIMWGFDCRSSHLFSIPATGLLGD